MTLHPLTRRFAVVAVSFALALGATAPAEAQGRHGGWGGGHGWHGHGYRGGPGWFWGGVGLGVGLGYYASPWYPGYIVVPPPSVTYYDVPAPPAMPAAPAVPNPIFYPRNGQSAEQTEADRQACNRWATTQPSAMADASVFHRATLACMDGRGYTAR